MCLKIDQQQFKKKMHMQNKAMLLNDGASDAVRKTGTGLKTL